MKTFLQKVSDAISNDIKPRRSWVYRGGIRVCRERIFDFAVPVKTAARGFFVGGCWGCWGLASFSVLKFKIIFFPYAKYKENPNNSNN